MKHFIFTPLFLFVVLTASLSSAQTITEIEPFNYGTLVVKNNNGIYSMTIEQNGSISSVSSQIIPISGQDAASYFFQDFPALTALNISFPSSVNLVGPSTNYFTIDNFDIPAAPITNVSGDYSCNVGSRLNTSGIGISYIDEVFTGNVTITVTY